MAADISKNNSEEKLGFKRILPNFIIVLIDLLGLTVIIPLMPLYAAKFQADAFTIGLLGATYPIFQFLGAPLLGRISDRYGRKPILIISQLGTFIGFLVLGFANTLWVLFLARLMVASRAPTSLQHRQLSQITPRQRPAPRVSGCSALPLGSD